MKKASDALQLAYPLSQDHLTITPPIATGFPMLAKIASFGLCGLEAYPVAIETDISPGLPAITVVGLPDNAVKESRERIRAAIKNSGFEFPAQRITINLAPADTKKQGPCYDLAIALGVLAAQGLISVEALNPFAFLGELSLDGRIQPIQGALSIALAAASSQCRGLVVPFENAKEAALAGCPVYPARHLNEVIAFLMDPQSLNPVKTDFAFLLEKSHLDHLDFSEVKAQQYLKRGLEIAAAGGHNVIMIGAPGSGKTMLAKRMTTILPDMTPAEVLQTTQIHSVAGLLKNTEGIISKRPFRAPHHTASDIAIIGGGNGPRPGEVTLAHNGILFLDEFLEFNRHVLEVLRQPLEDGYVTIARSKGSLRFPTRFMLIAAMNPCPCGYRDVQGKTCRCSNLQVEKYRHKISGPLLDRIDIHLHALPLKTRELVDAPMEESSATIKERTTKARQLQWQRFKGLPVLCNAHMESSHLRNFCALSKEAKEILYHTMEELKFSARAHDKIIKVARSIGDLAGSETIEAEHIAEAVGYRSLDRATF